MSLDIKTVMQTLRITEEQAKALDNLDGDANGKIEDAIFSRVCVIENPEWHMYNSL